MCSYQENSIYFWVTLVISYCASEVLITPVGALKACKKVDDCSCKIGGNLINIEPLGRQDGDPRFPYAVGEESDTSEFAYNPCYPFSDFTQNCKNAVACERHSFEHSVTYNLGDVTSTWTNDDNNYYVEYNHVDTMGFNRQSKVTLICDKTAEDATFERYGPVDDKQYIFTLTSKCACPGICGTLTVSSGGLSGGSILCIIFSAVVLVYLVGGVLFMKFARHERGMNIIPNYSVWVDLARSIKDGFLFAVNCFRRPGYEDPFKETADDVDSTNVDAADDRQARSSALIE